MRYRHAKPSDVISSDGIIWPGCGRLKVLPMCFLSFWRSACAPLLIYLLLPFSLCTDWSLWSGEAPVHVIQVGVSTCACACAPKCHTSTGKISGHPPALESQCMRTIGAIHWASVTWVHLIPRDAWPLIQGCTWSLRLPEVSCSFAVWKWKFEGGAQDVVEHN